MEERNMKRLSLLFVVLLVTALSCTKTPRAGEGITFRAKAYSASGTPNTKTVYGDIENTSQTYQMLHWAEGDVVRIYCPQAGLQEDASNHFDDCVVNGVSTSGTTSVATVASTHEHGLVWGEDNPHYFYAIYPSTATNAASTIVAGAGNAVTVTGTIPAEQTLTWTSGTTVVGAPDMDYAYMYASTSTAPNSSVDLQFVPKFTAFQLEIAPSTRQTSALTLTGFSLSTTDAAHALSGMFTIAGTVGAETLSCSQGETSVTVTLKDSNGDPIELTAGQTLIITVFALPQDLNTLTISFTGTQIGTRTLSLDVNGTPLTFVGARKYRIYGLTFPYINGIVGEGEGINWDGNIDVTSGGETITWDGQSNIVGAGTDDGAIVWGGMASMGGSNSEDVSWDGMTTQGGNSGEGVNWD